MNIIIWVANVASWAQTTAARLSTSLTIVVVLSLGLMGSKKTEHTVSPKPVSVEFRPSAEMQKLFDVFQGKWAVSETFEISASRQGKSRQGIASFRPGPGSSLIEDYNSSGSAGPLNFLALLWWEVGTSLSPVHMRQ